MTNQTCSAKTNTVCLDSVKFFAACVVAFVWHYQHFEPASGSPFGRVFSFSYPYGWLMVELFFMLSGFGMMLGYGSRILHRSVSFSQYMKKRLTRIYPLFFVTLVLVSVLQLVFMAKAGHTFVYPNFDLYHLFLNVILCQDGLFVTDWSFNSPSWCISICFILYVLFFIVFRFSKSIPAAVCRITGLGVLASAVLLLGWNYPVFNSLVARGLFCFSIGVVLAYLYQHEQRFNTKAIGYLCLVTLVGCYILYRIQPSSSTHMQMLFILFIAPMIIVCTVFVPWLNRLLSLRFFTYLGSLSMGIYLFHFPVQCVIKTVDIYCGLGLDYSGREVWLLYAASTLAVSILYKHLLAKPLTRIYTGLLDSIIIDRPSAIDTQ